jgi:hypothetical protein
LDLWFPTRQFASTGVQLPGIYFQNGNSGQSGCTLPDMLLRLAILVLFVSELALANDTYRQQPCKTSELAPRCAQIHGRLWTGNGTPSTRLWQIGTHHIYGIYSNRYGFIHDSPTLDNEAPELHFTFPEKRANQGGWTVYGDFEVCPLESLIQGQMQAACIDSATHIVVPKQ